MGRFSLPFERAYDKNGKPLDGAKLIFSETGTSTPKDTWSDIDLTTPNTNPVVADSQGQFGPIFLSGSYRVELTDKNDVTQPEYPEDDILGDPLGSIATVAAMRLTEGTADQAVILLGHTAINDGGQGAFYWDSASVEADDDGTIIKPTATITGRWKRLYTNRVHVGWFGPASDGVTNDAAKIQAAAAIVDAMGGGVLVFDAGGNLGVNWDDSDEILVIFEDCSGVTIEGNGSTITCAKTTATFKILFRAINCKGLSVTGLSVIGSNSTLTSLEGENFLHITESTTDVNIDDIFFSNAYRMLACNKMNGVLDDAGVRETGRCSRIKLTNIHTHTVYYPFFLIFSGDSTLITNAHTENTGRSLVLVNVKNVEATILSSQGSALSDNLLSCRAEAGFSDKENTLSGIRLNITSTGKFPGSPNSSPLTGYCQFDFIRQSVDAASCIVENIFINIDLDASTPSKYANALIFHPWIFNGTVNVLDTGGGRGHIGSKIHIEAVIHNATNLLERAAYLFNSGGGVTWTGSFIDGISVRDFQVYGAPGLGGLRVNGEGGTLGRQSFMFENVNLGPTSVLDLLNFGPSSIGMNGVSAFGVNACSNSFGSWAGAITGSTTGPSTPYTATGQYEKIGNQVKVLIFFSGGSTLGATGTYRITGLPFSARLTQPILPFAIVFLDNVDYTGDTAISVIAAGTDFIDLQTITASSSNAVITHTSPGVGQRVAISMSYFT